MESNDEIINRVANSALVTFDLENYYQPGERIDLDIKDQLFQGMILKEKDFREFIRTHNWSQYQNKFVAINCSVDAIIPQWAYMLVAIALNPFAKLSVFGSLEDLEIEIFRKSLSTVDWSEYINKKVVVKGCSKIAVPSALYVDVSRHLQPIVAGLMFGEPCSTVPLYKKPKG